MFLRGAAHELTAETSEDCRRQPELNPGGVFWSRPSQPIGTSLGPRRARVGRSSDPLTKARKCSLPQIAAARIKTLARIAAPKVSFR